MPGKLSKEELQRSFDGGELAAAGGRISLSAANPEFRQLLVKTVRKFAPRQGPIVSLGCGGGELEADLAQSGRAVVALDLRSSPAARLSRAGVPFLQADAHELPLQAGITALVIMSESIGQVDPVAVFAEVTRILRPGGALLLSTYLLPEAEMDDSLRLPFPFAGEETFLASPDQNALAVEYFRRSHYRLYPTLLLERFLNRTGLRIKHEERWRYREPDGQVDMQLLMAKKSG